MTNHGIPTNWSAFQIADLAIVNPKQLSGNTRKDYSFFYIDLSMVNAGKITEPISLILFGDAPSRARRLLKKGDVIMSMVRPNLCGHGQIVKSVTDWVCSTGFAVLRPKVITDQSYIYQYLLSEHVQGQINSLLAGSNYPAITPRDVEELSIIAPKSPLERSEISRILGIWDRAIDLVEGLITAEQERRSWLMQQLLTEKKNFSDFKKDWSIKTLGELVDPVQRPVPKPTEGYKALGIRSHCKGTFVRVVSDPATIEMEELFVAQKGDLIVNITFAWEGAIAFVPEEHDGYLVSHRFPMFRLKEDRVDADFFRYIVTNPRFIFQLGLISPGGAGRNRVMSKRDFLDIEVSVPCLEEQQKIGQLLKLVDIEIGLLNQQLDALREQKKGLKQQLLTGRIRVSI